jgi:SAM-dependent methyltransferase
VTVVMPVFNAEATLERAVASLIAQPFRDWEAVLVDDGSTDGSLALARRLAAKDGRVRVVHQANGGAGSARNRGIAEAKTEWLLFLDSDDYLDRQALRRLFAASQADPAADVVAGRGARVDASGRTWPFPRFDLSEPFSVLSGQCALVIHCAIVRRARAVEVGGFDATLPTSEDWDFWQKLARTGVRFHQIEPVVAFYHSNPGSLSKRVRQLATNTFEVMRRGHAPDPRVPNPHPAHANGASESNLAYLQLNFILWSAARDIADGGEGVSLLELIDPEVFATIDAEPNHLGEMIAAGMADVMSVQPAALGARWPEIGPKLRALLAAAYVDPSRARQRDMILLTIKNRFGVKIEDGAADETPAIVRVGLELGTPLRAVRRDGADVMAIQLRRGGRSLGVVFAPMLDDRSGADLADMVMEQFAALPMNAVAPALKPWRSLRFWVSAVKSLAELRGLGLRRALTGGNMPVAAIAKHRLRHAFIDGAETVVRGLLKVEAKADVEASPHRRRIEGMRETLAPPAVEAAEAGFSVAEDHPDQVRSAAAWDVFFEADDPWGYSGPHEQAKYDETLELVPAGGVESALELACAQGHFTAKLAPRVGRLLATDISAKALEGAAARCLGQPNVKFETLDFAREPIPGRFDLIVCSEVLYYLGDAERMREATRKIAAALNPGGRVIHTHANQIIDEPDRSGFDWGHAFGRRRSRTPLNPFPNWSSSTRSARRSTASSRSASGWTARRRSRRSSRSANSRPPCRRTSRGR